MGTMKDFSKNLTDLHNQIFRKVPELKNMPPEYSISERLAVYAGAIAAIKEVVDGAEAQKTRIGEVFDEMDRRMKDVPESIRDEIKTAISKICEVEQPIKTGGRAHG
jgi:hypothetical protein